MSNIVYADIRVKMHVKDRYNNSVCDYELEDGLAVADLICKEILGMDQYRDVYSVEVIKVGKANPLVVNIPDDFLISEE